MVLRPAPRRDDGRDHCPRVERPHLIDLLDRALQQHRRVNRSCALLVIDIALGRHPANPAHAETMMQTCIQRLQHGRRRQDRLARLGATRLALLLSEVTGAAKVERVVERLRTTLSQPVESSGIQQRPSPRIGFACYPEDAICPAALLEQGERDCTERHRPATILVS
ncbi:diguanylate cyclase domain-containing protein [Marichromatium purpuratum]|uniref:diguanylate cyclase domain-containing protein n=1 Tax=Marichromatium purpuratum TaxID=37487 RepID=UPI0022B47B5C|nr:diguanylate cyclase [Marichromatium purpuratum]